MSTKAVLEAGITAAIDDFPVALAWTPDGSALVVGGGDGGIHRVQMRDSVVQKLGEHAPGVLQLAWQPKGMLLASTGQDGSVRLWDMAAGDASPPRILHRAKAWSAGLAWRNDGERLAFTIGKDVLVYDSAGTKQREVGGTACRCRIWPGVAAMKSSLPAMVRCSSIVSTTAKWSSSCWKARR